MTNFAKMWLAAPDEIKAGFEPDDRQEWVCPECLKVYRRCEDCEFEGILWPYCEHYDERGIVRTEYALKPIPRLDQLLGMVKSKEWGLGPIDTEYAFSLDWTLSPSIFHAPTYEEAVLQGIAWEHGYKWTGEKWEVI